MGENLKDNDEEASRGGREMQSSTLLDTRSFGNQFATDWATTAAKIILVKIEICRKQI